MNKQPEITALTRKKLIDTYFDLMARGEKTTVATVTETAGYNRCTFYRYFTDTRDLLEQKETEICDAFQHAVDCCDLQTDADGLVSLFVGVYEQYGSYISVLLGGYGDPNFIGRMKQIIRPIAMQIFASASDFHTAAELKTVFVLSGVLAVIKQWYASGQPIPASQLGDLIREMILQGVLKE